MERPPFEAGEGLEAQAERQRKIKAAMAWLKEELRDSTQPAGETRRKGKEAGHAERTLQEAASRLHIKPQRVYEGGRLKHWEWSLPAKKH